MEQNLNDLALQKMMAEAEKKRNKESRKQFWRVFFGRGLYSKICFCIMVIFIFVSVFCPLLTKYTPYEQSLVRALEGPSADHILGTDYLGRDLWSRVVYGARLSLVTGLLSSFVSLIIGSILGLIAGYSRGFLQGFIMRCVDAIISIPGLILTMCLVSIFGGSVLAVSLIIGFTSIPGYIRMLYGQVLALRENDYVTAADLIGQSKWQIMIKHLLPNCFPLLIVMFTGSVGGAVMAQSGLAYLGIGIKPPTPAWGSMVSEGYNYLLFKPHLALIPGIAMMLLIISLNIVGDGLRDALDPRLRGKL